MATHVGRGLVTLIAVATATLAYVFDWNETHIFNPRWPEHAKFHNAQTMLLSTGLGLTSLWLVWRPEGDRWRNFRAAAVVASLDWITQLGSGLFPGTALIDAEFRDRPGAYVGGVMPIQPILCTTFLLTLAVAWAMEWTRHRAGRVKPRSE